MNINTSKYKDNCQAIINSWISAKEKAEDGLINSSSAFSLIARSRGLIENITGKQSYYSIQMNDILSMGYHEAYKAELLIGLIDGLLDDLDHGFIDSISNLVCGAIFQDYLEMAQHLLNEGYKDAAAVIAGSTLENHLKQLCIKHDISINFTAKDGSIQPKKSSIINQELGKNVYSLYDQKQITAWLDLRNNAAHGIYESFTHEQVQLLIDGLRDFISRHSL